MAEFAYYYALRDEARQRTMNALNRRILRSGQIRLWDRLTLCSVTGNALAFAAREWPKYHSGDTYAGFGESWEKCFHHVYPGRDYFDLAIWQAIEEEDVLVAMALGNPSHGRTHLTVKWIERYMGPNYLGGRALWPILTCAEEYAKLLGCRRVLIKDPVDPGTFARYGYKPYRHPQVPHGGSYLAREVEHG